MADAVPHESEPLRGEEVIELGELTMTSERDGDMHRIGLVGELDLASTTAVHDELARVEASDTATIVLDLSGLTFLDSSGIRLLVQAAERSHADRRLALRRGGPAVHRALQLSGLAERLPFTD